MPRIENKYICKGCEEVYFSDKFADFRICSKCEIETCYECGRMVNGKVYCRDCKPIQTDYYDRSVE